MARTLAFLLVAAVVMSCTAGTPPPLGQCEFDADCGAGLVCADRSCRTGCRVDRDCPPTFRCLAGDRTGSLACVPAPATAPACRRDSECAEGTACLNGTCRAQCVADYDCQIFNRATRCTSGRCILVCAGGTMECDGDLTNGCEALNTTANCGTCGNRCVVGFNSVAVCRAGVCGLTCNSGFADCNGSVVDGCEVNVQIDTGNCGACGTGCSFPGAGARCSAGRCEATTCRDPSFGDCDGVSTNGCETDLRVASTNCGRCGNTCMLVNAVAACRGSACAVDHCDTGFADCDGVASNGCEVDTRASAGNCGRCGVRCSLFNATAACRDSACVVDHCNPSFGDCDNSPGNGCEVDTRVSAPHCGVCGHACPSGQACVAGACVTLCIAPRMVCGAACVDTGSDASNCGSCGHACTAGQVCSAGVCASTCPSPRMMCGAACVDTGSDTSNCGSCGHACSTGQVCSAGVCTTLCVTPRLMCGAACVDPTTDLMNCGACGHVCPAAAHATLRCASSTCGFSCSLGFGDCNHAPDDGCEAPLDTVTSCGACGTTCPGTMNGSAVCASGSCDLRCDAGFARVGAGCSAVVAPRLTGPLSGSIATTRRPIFRWLNAPSADGAHVQICRDRACTMEVASFDATGASGSPATALAAGVYFWRAFGRLGAVTGVAVSTTTYEIVVPARDAGRNTAWGAFGDVNGDGFADALVGQSRSSRVFVHHGSSSGISTTATTTLTPGFIITGGGGGSDFGQSVAIAGDVNGDGFVDAVVGNPSARSIYVFRGSAAGLPSTGNQISTSIFGFGTAVAGAGDVNGDGFADVLVYEGAELQNVDVLYGSASGLLSTVSHIAAAHGNAPMAGVGKIDSDEFDDVVIATSDSTGPAFLVFRGSATGLSTTATARIGLASVNAVAAAGDMNGDGFADVLAGNAIGAMTANAWLYTGSAAGLVSTVAFNFTQDIVDFGSSISSVGDVNGDGFGDVIVGDSATAAAVYYGSATLTDLGSTNLRGRPGAFAAAVTSAGDFDRDGFWDVLAGSPVPFFMKVCDGVVFMFRGARMGVSTDPAVTLTPPPTKACSTGFGISVAWNARWPWARHLG